MTAVNILQILFFVLVISVAILFIYILRHDEGIDYDKWIKIYLTEKEETLKQLEDGNKEIDKIERQILECKKKLKMRLFEYKK